MSAERGDARNKSWLSVVGIGEDGIAGLGDEAKRRISEAEIVFGGKRHLGLVDTLLNGEAHAWPTPFDAEMTDVRSRRGQRVCVLASGDPFLFGVGATLARHVPGSEMRTFPAPSAFSLAASRLGWPLAETETVSLHGRDIAFLLPLLHPGERVLALTSDAQASAAIAAMLVDRGFGASQLWLLEALGGSRERLRVSRADQVDWDAIHPLNVLAIEVDSDWEHEALVLPLAPGLPDDRFEHDGQITKREIRALTLSALAPRRGEWLWDIGAGAGSVAIEWKLAHRSMRAFAIEGDAGRVERITRNASSCGVPDLVVVHGQAPDALARLTTPDAIFVGGGGSDPGVMEMAMARLRRHGRLVANAVTLEMEAVLLALHAKVGGSLQRIAISRAAPVGSMQAWRPAMPVTQWSWVKP